MLDKLLSIKNTQSHSDKFTILNTKMDMAVAIDLLLSVFDYERCEALSKALVAEIKRRKALFLGSTHLATNMTIRQFSECYEPLTPREMEVVSAICAGHTKRNEIAEALEIKPKTVTCHLSTIYGKLFVNNMTALVLYAIRSGWCDEYGHTKDNPNA